MNVNPFAIRVRAFASPEDAVNSIEWLGKDDLFREFLEPVREALPFPGLPEHPTPDNVRAKLLENGFLSRGLPYIHVPADLAFDDRAVQETLSRNDYQLFEVRFE